MIFIKMKKQLTVHYIVSSGSWDDCKEPRGMSIEQSVEQRGTPYSVE